MFNYEKRLQYPVNIRRTDAQMAKAIITQFGGPDGETGASLRYLSQRFAMPYREVMGILTDIGMSVTRKLRPFYLHGFCLSDKFPVHIKYIIGEFF